MIRRRERGGYWKRGNSHIKASPAEAKRLIEHGRHCEQKSDWLAAKLMYERAKQCADDTQLKMIAWRLEFIEKLLIRLDLISESVYE